MKLPGSTMISEPLGVTAADPGELASWVMRWSWAVSPAGRAMAAAMTAGAMTQQITMVMVCRGVIPTALNTPRSWTRSRVAISAALSTPRPASTATSTVSHANKDVSRNPANDAAPSEPTTMPGPSARCSAPV